MTETAAGHTASGHFHFTDPYDGGYGPLAFTSQVGVKRHQHAANYLFLDGHVDRLAWSVVLPELSRIGSRLVNPAGHQP